MNEVFAYIVKRFPENIPRQCSRNVLCSLHDIYHSWAHLLNFPKVCGISRATSLDTPLLIHIMSVFFYCISYRDSWSTQNYETLITKVSSWQVLTSFPKAWRRGKEPAGRRRNVSPSLRYAASVAPFSVFQPALSH